MPEDFDPHCEALKIVFDVLVTQHHLGNGITESNMFFAESSSSKIADLCEESLERTEIIIELSDGIDDLPQVKERYGQENAHLEDVVIDPKNTILQMITDVENEISRLVPPVHPIQRKGTLHQQ